VEPLDGITWMQQRRQTEKRERLSTGPGRLCEAFAIDRQLDGVKLTSRRRVWIEHNPAITICNEMIRSTQRIGVTSAGRLKLRFVLQGNGFVSGPRSLG
jgi:DNA-3-methyladenine glycosylase